MKVMVGFSYFHPHMGGAENYSLNFALQLQRLGWEISVVTSRPEARTVVEEDVLGLRVIGLPTLVTLSNTPFHPRWGGWLRQVLSNEHPDVINLHTPVPIFSDVAAHVSGGSPVVITYHNDLVKQGRLSRPLTELYHRTVLDRTLRRCARIITTSQVYVDQSPYLRPHLGKTAVVPPGVDTRRFRPDLERSYWRERYPGRGPVVLFVGSLGPSHRHKGLEVLIRAVAAVRRDLPDIHLAVVGGGDPSSYREVAARAGIVDRVSFEGFLADDLLPAAYAGADVCCLPSLTTAEGFGMVLAESMACGTPVVGSRVGGVPALLEMAEGGLLAEPGDEHALAQALQRVVGSEQIWRSLSRRGAQKVRERLSWEQLAGRYERILQEAAVA